jgi:hypothetical protein
VTRCAWQRALDTLCYFYGTQPSQQIHARRDVHMLSVSVNTSTRQRVRCLSFCAIVHATKRQQRQVPGRHLQRLFILCADGTRKAQEHSHNNIHRQLQCDRHTQILEGETNPTKQNAECKNKQEKNAAVVPSYKVQPLSIEIQQTPSL